MERTWVVAAGRARQASSRHTRQAAPSFIPRRIFSPPPLRRLSPRTRRRRSLRWLREQRDGGGTERKPRGLLRVVMETARPLRLVALGKSSPVGTIKGCKGHGAPCSSLSQGELEKKRGTEVRTASRGRGHVGFAGARRGVPSGQRGRCLSTNTPQGSTGWAMGFISADTCRGEGGGAKLGSFVPSDACGGEVCRKPEEGSAWGSSRLQLWLLWAPSLETPPKQIPGARAAPWSRHPADESVARQRYTVVPAPSTYRGSRQGARCRPAHPPSRSPPGRRFYARFRADVRGQPRRGQSRGISSPLLSPPRRPLRSALIKSGKGFS